jgi:hypothetical protein
VLTDVKAQQAIAPLVHIGYHKTATTWLQKHLWNNEACGFASPLRKSDEIQAIIVAPHPLDFDIGACQEKLRPTIERVQERRLIPIISSERLVGSPHSGGYDSKELADRLHAVLPESRIVAVIREQRSAIWSTYKQYVRAGGVCPLNRYLLPPSRGAARVPQFRFDHFEYHRLIGHYRSLFGEANVLVLPYELFCSNPQSFVTQILRFAANDSGAEIPAQLPFDSHPNLGMSALSAGIKRGANRIFARDAINPAAWFDSPNVATFLERRVLASVDRLVPRAIRTRLDRTAKKCIDSLVASRYRASNRQLAAMLPWDPAEFGYDV